MGLKFITMFLFDESCRGRKIELESRKPLFWVFLRKFDKLIPKKTCFFHGNGKLK